MTNRSEKYRAAFREAQEIDYCFIRNTEYTRIAYGGEDGDWGADKYPCHDCGVTKGQYHLFGCDVEECPRCHGQTISCGCGGLPDRKVLPARPSQAKKLIALGVSEECAAAFTIAKADDEIARRDPAVAERRRMQKESHERGKAERAEARRIHREELKQQREEQRRRERAEAEAQQRQQEEEKKRARESMLIDFGGSAHVDADI